MKFVDDKCKKINWWNRNYCFAGTLLFIIVNILIYAIWGYGWTNGIGGEYVWNGTFDISNLVRSFLDSFEHYDWEHVLLNMLDVLVLGIYIERKEGTFNFILMMLSFSFLSGCVNSAGRNTIAHYGASGLNYFCYAYVIIDYIFSTIKKETRNKTNIILGALVLVYIYVAMCYAGDGFSFELWPYSFITNIGHFSSFVAGVIVSLLIQFAQCKRSGNVERKDIT